MRYPPAPPRPPTSCNRTRHRKAGNNADGFLQENEDIVVAIIYHTL